MRVGWHHDGGDDQHQEHVGLRTPERSQPENQHQGRQRDNGCQRQVARAEAHAIAQRDPEQRCVDRQCLFASQYHGKCDAGVVMQHREKVPPEEVTWPALDEHAQEYRDEDERADVDNDGHVARGVLWIEADQDDDIQQRTSADDQA
ncbi:hypothetical protein D3C78_1320480 [compost metagenome]